MKCSICGNSGVKLFRPAVRGEALTIATDAKCLICTACAKKQQSKTRLVPAVQCKRIGGFWGDNVIPFADMKVWELLPNR